MLSNDGHFELKMGKLCILELAQIVIRGVR
jgi:hypothetical protein